MTFVLFLNQFYFQVERDIKYQKSWRWKNNQLKPQWFKYVWSIYNEFPGV